MYTVVDVITPRFIIVLLLFVGIFILNIDKIICVLYIILCLFYESFSFKWIVLSFNNDNNDSNINKNNKIMRK